VENKRVGDTVQLTVLRDRKRLVVPVRLEAPPNNRF